MSCGYDGGPGGFDGGFDGADGFDGFDGGVLLEWLNLMAAEPKR